jgi:hypothetical protein
VLAFLAALALAAPARADSIPWGFTTTLGGAGALPGSGTSTMVISADSPGTGTVQLSGDSNPKALGSSDIVPISIQILSAPAGSTNNLTTTGNYTLFVNLTDTNSGDTGTLTFTGKLGGSFTSSSAALLTNGLTSASVQTIQLGNDLYTVTIGGYVPPSPPGAMNMGSIGGHVDVSEVPEPTSLLLGGLGLLGGAVLGLRRRPRPVPASR